MYKYIFINFLALSPSPFVHYPQSLSIYFVLLCRNFSLENLLMNIKTKICRIVALIVTAIIAVALPLSASAKFTVVIDPGHGKEDHGAIGKISSEKNINLDVALKLGKLISDNMPDVKIVYTRSNDTYVPLQGRADIANDAKGDLFISIHTNSISKKSPKYRTIEGASVYTLGFRRSQENLEVAMRENSVIKLEDDYTTTYEGFNPSSAESYIIFEMSRNIHIEQSLEAANFIQQELVSTAGRKDRGVRQANFWVLFKTSMPAILVELDFICNPQMEKFMTSSKGSTLLATAIYNGFARYKLADDHRRGITTSTLKTITVEETTRQPKEEAANNTENKNTETSGTSDKQQHPDTQIIYKVQFFISKDPLPASSPKFKGIDDVSSYRQNGLIKYTSGEFTSEKKANKRLSKIRKKYPDAFIIKTKAGKRIQ